MPKGKPVHGHRDNDYDKFSSDISGIVCTACHEFIRPWQKIFALHAGRERPQRPLMKYLRFTGIIWHEGCVDIQALPGMAGRDLDDDVFGRVPEEKKSAA